MAGKCRKIKANGDALVNVSERIGDDLVERRIEFTDAAEKKARNKQTKKESGRGREGSDPDDTGQIG